MVEEEAAEVVAEEVEEDQEAKAPDPVSQVQENTTAT